MFLVFCFRARLHFVFATGLAALVLRRLKLFFFWHAKKFRI